MDVARRLAAEIVNADAFCLYRGMDIGTAKPTSGDRAQIPHHVLDTHDVGDEVQVAAYQSRARAAIEEITGRGVPALLVGGSGLYVQAVLDDLRFPGTDPRVRARLEAELAEVGPGRMHDRLARTDPRAAAAILPGNGRRIVRALEVNEITGGPFTATMRRRPGWRTSVRIGWDPGVEAVDRAIATRVATMWASGFVEEVRGLAPRMGRTASRAVGYRQVLDALAADADPDNAMQPTILATRRLARRQRRWFRRDEGVHWANSSSQVAQILGRVGV
jgi:tRNA dimethylallyltransferase